MSKWQKMVLRFALIRLISWEKLTRRWLSWIGLPQCQKSNRKMVFLHLMWRGLRSNLLSVSLAFFYLGLWWNASFVSFTYFHLVVALIQNPFQSGGLLRNPKSKNAGTFLKVPEFLELAKKNASTGILIGIQVSFMFYLLESVLMSQKWPIF